MSEAESVTIDGQTIRVVAQRGMMDRYMFLMLGMVLAAPFAVFGLIFVSDRFADGFLGNSIYTIALGILAGIIAILIGLALARLVTGRIPPPKVTELSMDDWGLSISGRRLAPRKKCRSLSVELSTRPPVMAQAVILPMLLVWFLVFRPIWGRLVKGPLGEPVPATWSVYIGLRQVPLRFLSTDPAEALASAIAELAGDDGDPAFIYIDKRTGPETD